MHESEVRLNSTLQKIQGQNRGSKGFQHLANLTPVQAARRVIAWLYDGIPLPEVFQPNQTQPKTVRNAEIRQRYAAGESMLALAAEYGISKQRVHQIVAAAHD